MATAASFVKLLRQLAEAKDDYLTGALDISWDGGKATLFLVFGQPNHAVLETFGGDRLEGPEALTALARLLPPRFQLSAWRKEVVRAETLTCSVDELMAPFAQRAGAGSPARVSPEGGGNGGVSTGEPDFGLADFPLLPLGPSLWAEASAGVVHLETLLSSLPDALVVLTGPRLRAAAVVVRQQLIDAVWVDEEERTMGEAAAMALMGARQGTVSGYRLENPRFAEALTMLWRCPSVYREMPAAWVNTDSLLADLEGRRRDSAIVVTGGVHGVALVAGGELVGVFTESERQPLASLERLTTLLRSPGARVTLRQSPEASLSDRLPETAYHAFVAGPDAPMTLPPEVEPLPAAGAIAPDAAAPGGPAPPESAAAPPATEPGAHTRVPPPPRPPTLAATRPPLEADGELGGPEWSPPPTPEPAWAGSDPPEPEAPPAALDPMSIGAADPDVEAVKLDLIQIGTLWLGNDGAEPIAEMIRRTRPSIEDVMSTIEAIRHVDLPGQEQSVLQAMTREMHFHAAEYLSGL